MRRHHCYGDLVGMHGAEGVYGDLLPGREGTGGHGRVRRVASGAAPEKKGRGSADRRCWTGEHETGEGYCCIVTHC